VALGAEIAAALRVGSVLGPPRAGDSPEVVVAGLAWLPIVGLGIGVAAAGAAALAGPAGAASSGLAGAGVLALLGGAWLRVSLWPAAALLAPGDAARVVARLRAPTGVGALVTGAATVGAMAAVLASMPPPARTAALLLAPTLARWAMVVQCHGGRGPWAGGPAAAIVGRAGFREFGIASVAALGTALVLADALGLVAAMAAAALTLGVRLLAHRRLGGLSGALVAATGGAGELLVVVVLAGLL